MKTNQKLIVVVDNFKFLTTFKDLDEKLYSVAAKLESTGDLWGPVCDVIDDKCICISYADKPRGPTKQTIFGYDSEDFMKKKKKTI